MSVKARYIRVTMSCFLVFGRTDTSRDLPFHEEMRKMVSSIEVKKEIEGRLSEANANEKYLYSRVMELEKRNQKLEKRVSKLKRKKKELKQEVAKLRGKIQSQVSKGGEALTGQDEDQGVSQRTLCKILKTHLMPWDDISLFWNPEISLMIQEM